MSQVQLQLEALLAQSDLFTVSLQVQLSLQCDETIVQQNLSVQFGCQTDVVVFSAI
jgi:hypothetical protein